MNIILWAILGFLFGGVLVVIEYIVSSRKPKHPKQKVIYYCDNCGCTPDVIHWLKGNKYCSECKPQG